MIETSTLQTVNKSSLYQPNPLDLEQRQDWEQNLELEPEYFQEAPPRHSLDQLQNLKGSRRQVDPTPCVNLQENPDTFGDQSPPKSQSKSMALPSAGTPQKKSHTTPHKTPKEKSGAQPTKSQMQS
jgi:hypothetical protein